MSKVTVYVGRNVSELKFCTGMFSQETPYGIFEGTIYINPMSTSRHMPETNLHPTDICLALVKDVDWCLNRWDLSISTTSKHVIDSLGELIRANVLKIQDISINILNEDNQIDSVAGFDAEGYLTNWPVGCLSPNFDLLEEKIKELKNKIEQV